MPLTPNTWTKEHFLQNASECETILENPEILSSIPLLDSTALHLFSDGQLVKFRGMIQDMHNPEFFFESYKVKNTTTNESHFQSGLYSDVMKCLPNEEILVDCDENQSSVRQTLVIISIPGLNPWAKEKNNTQESTPKSLNSEKRTFHDMETEDSEKTAKKGKSSEERNQDKIAFLSKEHILNFPISHEGGTACFVKIYDEDDTKYKLNEILDVVGFLSLDPSLGIIGESEDLEIQTRNPPASVVPRLHAIKIQNVTRSKISQDSELDSKIEIIRGDLHMVLKQLLFGDDLAADFLICHLISSVYKRIEVFALGSFPLNLMNFPVEKSNEFSKELSNILSSMVPKSYFLECTLDNLNELSFIPKKDYECNRLTSGMLQLSDNTHLIIDESKLSPGSLSATGRKNYNAICDVVTFQNLNYDFQYYNVEYSTDIPVLILSEGQSFIKNTIIMPIEKNEETHKIYSEVVEAAKIYLKDENRLNNIRKYLISQRFAEFKIHDDVVNMIQEEFVNLRKMDSSINSDDFHRLIVFARLMSLSHGLKSLNQVMWKKVVEMDTERRNRLASRK